MLANPCRGDRVRLCYAKKKQALVPLWNELNGCAGTVVIPGRRTPRNHMVKLDDGRRFVVPCGNLMKL